ncbi:MAG: ribosome maturation factor RimM [Anaerolineae bacterium]|nr:ribosome maturation factor RimM [Anaerolineae bacterium]
MTDHSAGPEDTPSGPFYLLLGEILRPHGIRGELRVRILTDYPERMLEFDSVHIGTDPESPEAAIYQIEKLRLSKGYGLLKLEGIDDRNQAELLRDLYVMIDVDEAIPLEEGEFYLYQVIGLTVQTEQGQALGTIREVLETGANDVYIIDSPEYKEILLPVTPETVLNTDIQSGLVTVRLPEGLLP